MSLNLFYWLEINAEQHIMLDCHSRHSSCIRNIHHPSIRQHCKLRDDLLLLLHILQEEFYLGFRKHPTDNILPILVVQRISFAWYFSKACCALWRVLVFACVFFSTIFDLASSFNAICRFWAIRVTPALPILKLHIFQCPEAENAFLLLSSSSTCCSAVSAQSTCTAKGTTASKMPGLKPTASTLSTNTSYLSCKLSRALSCVCCPSSLLTFGLWRHLRVKGTNWIFSQEPTIFAFVKWQSNGQSWIKSLASPFTIVTRSESSKTTRC